MFDPWNYIDVSYWALNSCPFIDNFSGILSLGDEWWLDRWIFIFYNFDSNFIFDIV